VQFRVVGCSPAWPNPGGSHSGYLLEADGDRILLDCGPGVLPRLRAEEGWPRIDAIVISHFHLDHCGDLVPWLWGCLTGGAPPAPALRVPPGGRDELAALASRFDEAFDVHEYDGPFDTAGFHVTPYRVSHYTQPTWGLRVERGGVVLAYSADSGPTDALVELARDADLFVCEATLAGVEPEPRGHLTADEAAGFARRAGAKRLLLTHRPVELDAPGVEVARDGLQLDLSSSE